VNRSPRFDPGGAPRKLYEYVGHPSRTRLSWKLEQDIPLFQGRWNFCELLCHPESIQLTRTLVENDFESLIIFISEFDLQELVQGFEDVSIPESASIQKKAIQRCLFPGP
jgi:hypothetical protein